MTPAAPSDIEAYLTREAQGLTSRCTSCGKCVEVCPVVPYSLANAASSPAVVSSVVDLLKERSPLSDPASAWTHGCNGCGDCISACPEEINPRRMLMLAVIRDTQRSSKTPELFRRMSRAIKLMVAMQLAPQEYKKLLVPNATRTADFVFYLGCNALRTPNLLFNTMYLLDSLELEYDVIGGPSACCGVIATKWQGQTSAGAKITSNTLSRFEGTSASRVLNWCPTCENHLGEVMDGFLPRTFEFDHVTTYLLQRAQDLTALMRTPVTKRVVLHAHKGMSHIGQNVLKLLSAIPGLEIVQTVWESSYTCGGSGCSKTPQLRDEEHEQLVQTVRATGADALVTLYHGCHMAFLPHAAHGEFDVVNFTELLAQSIGLAPHHDKLKEYRVLTDWKEIAAEAQLFLSANGVKVENQWLQANGEELFSVSEFRGGMQCLGELPLAT